MPFRSRLEKKQFIYTKIVSIAPTGAGFLKLQLARAASFFGLDVVSSGLTLSCTSRKIPDVELSSGMCL